jgi:molybdopterin converting factor small subunit
VKILFYGRLADAIGPELEIGAPAGTSVAELRRMLFDAHPQVADVLHNKRTRACVGDMLVREDFRLAAGDTLEFLPPVSGG